MGRGRPRTKHLSGAKAGRFSSRSHATIDRKPIRPLERQRMRPWLIEKLDTEGCHQLVRLSLEARGGPDVQCPGRRDVVGAVGQTHRDLKLKDVKTETKPPVKCAQCKQLLDDTDLRTFAGPPEDAGRPQLSDEYERVVLTSMSRTMPT